MAARQQTSRQTGGLRSRGLRQVWCRATMGEAAKLGDTKSNTESKLDSVALLRKDGGRGDMFETPWESSTHVPLRGAARYDFGASSGRKQLSAAARPLYVYVIVYMARYRPPRQSYILMSLNFRHRNGEF